MTSLNANVPDALYRQVEALAAQENISILLLNAGAIDQLVSIALAAQVSAWTTKSYLEEKSSHGSWEKFQQVLAKVPDVEPEDYDRL